MTPSEQLNQPWRVGFDGDVPHKILAGDTVVLESSEYLVGCDGFTIDPSILRHIVELHNAMLVCGSDVDTDRLSGLDIANARVAGYWPLPEGWTRHVSGQSWQLLDNREIAVACVDFSGGIVERFYVASCAEHIPREFLLKLAKVAIFH